MTQSDEIRPSRETYAKLHANTFGLSHQGQTSTEAQAALDEIDRLRVAVNRLVNGMRHPDRCSASYGPMHRCDCGVQKLINEVLG